MLNKQAYTNNRIVILPLMHRSAYFHKYAMLRLMQWSSMFISHRHLLEEQSSVLQVNRLQFAAFALHPLPLQEVTVQAFL